MATVETTKCDRCRALDLREPGERRSVEMDGVRIDLCKRCESSLEKWFTKPTRGE